MAVPNALTAPYRTGDPADGPTISIILGEGGLIRGGGHPAAGHYGNKQQTPHQAGMAASHWQPHGLFDWAKEFGIKEKLLAALQRHK